MTGRKSHVQGARYSARDLPARERFEGCLLGGAVGDALGAPVEFMRRDEILRRFGPDGTERLAKSELPRDAAIAELGEGWVAEEALAISVY